MNCRTHTQPDGLVRCLPRPLPSSQQTLATGAPRAARPLFLLLLSPTQAWRTVGASCSRGLALGQHTVGTQHTSAERVARVLFIWVLAPSLWPPVERVPVNDGWVGRRRSAEP